MKRLSLIAALTVGVALACITANAQDSAGKKDVKRGAPRAEQQLQRLSKNLDLTDAQKPKIKALLNETEKKREELTKESTTAPRERRTKMAALMREQDKKMKDILTPDQYAKFEKGREEARNKAKNKAPGEKAQKRDL